MKKHKKIDKLALRLTADRVLGGTAPKNSVAYMKEVATKFSRTVKRLEEAQEKESDSAEEGKDSPLLQMNEPIWEIEKIKKEFDGKINEQLNEKETD